MSSSASSATGIGVGIESMLSGPTGPAVVYQTPSFHVEGIVGFFDSSDAEGRRVLVAGRYFHQIHAGDLADLSLGAGLGLLNVEVLDESDTDVHVEVGAKIRAFLVPNVALGAQLGMAFVVRDGDDLFALTGDVIGSMGITYFFF